ncbi:histone deacetylase 1/2 [Strigomonas culicis]|uniref:Histone deacetylase 1/2 n=1 Tax=Strigomonas culicis TaxID=28005 RepID=S9USQ1_9TRYP|nr:histone deacetylase 1/2 [Strigomonas culicis]|eukprot:EPY31834.1 histone deacetylase 1/2 [Strigomonas culicis]
MRLQRSNSLLHRRHDGGRLCRRLLPPQARVRLDVPHMRVDLRDGVAVGALRVEHGRRVVALVLRYVQQRRVLEEPSGARHRVHRDGGAERQRAAAQDAGLVRPQLRHVADRVAAAADGEQRQAELSHKLHAPAVAPGGEVEQPEAVLREGVRAELQHHRVRREVRHHLRQRLREDGDVEEVVDAVPQAQVHRVVAAAPDADVGRGARAGEEALAELVQRQREDAVALAEGLVDAVAVVHVEVNVQHPLVALEQLDDAEDNVVHIAEAAALAALGVVHAAAPVHRDIDPAAVEQHGAHDGAARRRNGVLDDALHRRAVARVEDLRRLGVPHPALRVVHPQVGDEGVRVVRLEGLDLHQRRDHRPAQRVQAEGAHELHRGQHAVGFHRMLRQQRRQVAVRRISGRVQQRYARTIDRGAVLFLFKRHLGRLEMKRKRKKEPLVMKDRKGKERKGEKGVFHKESKKVD